MLSPIKSGVLFILLFTLACTGKDLSIYEQEVSIAKVSTRLGDMYFWMYNQTQNHKTNFIELANAQHYNQFTFNRVVKNFVIQGGCPDSVQYFENSPYLLEPEFVDRFGHKYGALGMGRDNNPDKLSNACQFYIVCKEAGLPNLDNQYMIFGEIIEGIDVLEAIEKESTDNKDKPLVAIPLDVSIVEFTTSQFQSRFGIEPTLFD